MSFIGVLYFSDSRSFASSVRLLLSSFTARTQKNDRRMSTNHPFKALWQNPKQPTCPSANKAQEQAGGLSVKVADLEEKVILLGQCQSAGREDVRPRDLEWG